MDGEVQPKFGLMVSLVLMNLSAIALFFYTSNAPLETSRAKDTEKTEMIMAGDAQKRDSGKESSLRNSNDDRQLLEKPTYSSRRKTSLAETVSPVAGEGAVRSSKTLSSLPRANKAETMEQKEPAIAVALRNFMGKSSSGVKIFFDGLKSCREKRISASLTSLLSIKNSSSVNELSQIPEQRMSESGRKVIEGSPASYRTAESLELGDLKDMSTREPLQESSKTGTPSKNFAVGSLKSVPKVSSRKSSKSPEISTQQQMEQHSKKGSPVRNDDIKFAVAGSKSFPHAVSTRFKSPEASLQRQDKSNKKSSNSKDTGRELVVGSFKSTPTISSRVESSKIRYKDTLQLEEEPTPSWIYGKCDSDTLSHQETFPMEMIMEILSQTQKRTSQLIDIFSKKVVPAIERMNDKVADAIRLEKNLDSYTLTLIKAINSVVCPMAHDTTERPKAKPITVKKLRQTKAFCGDLSLMRDSHIRDYVGFFSKGERGKLKKRPVFKTLARHYCRSKSKEKNIPKKSRYGQRLEQNCDMSASEKENALREQTQAVIEQAENHISQAESDNRTINPRNPDMDVQSSSVGVNLDNYKLEFQEKHRTIGIDEVLTLTSYLEPEEHSNSSLQPVTVSENVNSDVSMTSGMVNRIPFVLDAPQIVTRMDESEDESLGALKGSELSEDLIVQLKQHIAALGSDMLTVCDSHLQEYDSSLGQRESSTLSEQLTPRFEEVKPTLAQTISTLSGVKEHQSDLRILGEMNESVDLVNGFLQLNSQHKEVAMENICWLILRMFEAWSESQRHSLTPTTLSGVSSNTWSCTDNLVPQNPRPQTAIFRAKEINQNPLATEMDSLKEQSFTAKDHPEVQTLSNQTQASNGTQLGSSQSVEISSDLVTNIVEAAEVQIAEHTLMGLKSTLSKKQPIKRGDLQNVVDVTATASQSGFGDMKDSPVTGEEAAALESKSHKSVLEDSKESSIATFYTDQRESSEDAFYECASTYSAGTYGSLEVEDSSKLFLEKIQEENAKGLQDKGIEAKNQAIVEELPAIQYATTVESWLKSGSEFRNSEDILKSEEYAASESSLVSVYGTDEETYVCSSQDVSADESQVEKSEAGQQKKKKKWASKFIKKLLKKKSKPSSIPDIVPSKASSKSQSDYALKAEEKDALKKVEMAKEHNK